MMITLLPDYEENTLLSPYDLLSLKEAGIHRGAFAMRPLNQWHLEQLAQSDPETWPAIQVTLTDKGYVLIDGYHRWEIAKKGVMRLKATCKPYTSEAEIIEAAFRANLTHGLKASQQTRGDYAYWLFKTFPDMRQEEIALKTQITQGAVSKAISKRDELIKRAQQQQEEEDAKARQKAAIKATKSFTRIATRILKDLDLLDDQELETLLNTQIKTTDTRNRLTRIGRILAGPDPLAATGTTGPLKLRQFIPPQS